MYRYARQVIAYKSYHNAFWDCFEHNFIPKIFFYGNFFWNLLLYSYYKRILKIAKLISSLHKIIAKNYKFAWKSQSEILHKTSFAEVFGFYTTTVCFVVRCKAHCCLITPNYCKVIMSYIQSYTAINCVINIHIRSYWLLFHSMRDNNVLVGHGFVALRCITTTDFQMYPCTICQKRCNAQTWKLWEQYCIV